jgi:hypothetical protein
MKIIRSLLFTCLFLLALNSSAQVITPTDTALTRDLKYTITPFSIKADTADAADNKALQLTGGGAVSSTRGAYIGLAGNEHANNGMLQLEAGNDAAGGVIYFNTGGVQHLNIPYSTTPAAELAFGTALNVNPMLTIRSNKIDGADDASLALTPGGAVSYTRGAYILLSGNEFTIPGVLHLGGGSGGIFMYTGGLQHLNIPYSATQAVDLAYGTAFDASPVFTIRSSRSDGSDDGILNLTGGGSSTLAGNRGAYIQLEGQDVGGTDKGGDINIVGGLGASGTDYPIVTIRNDSVDGADWGRVAITSGGAATESRGGLITLYGEQSATNPGHVQITGAALNGEIRLATHTAYRLTIADTASSTTPEIFFGDAGYNAVTATMRFATHDGDDDSTLQITSSGSSTLSGTRGAYIILQGQDVNNANRGGDITLAAAAGSASYTPLATLRTDTVNGSDWGTVEIYAADTLGTTRAASIVLQGDDVGGAGAGGGITFEAGTGTAATLKFNTAGANKWTINADGTLDAAISDAGFRAAAAGDQACTTTCGANKGCLFGYDITTTALVDCTNAAADSCVCTTT